jgi:putative transposase
MAILELRAAQGWSLSQTAAAFLVTASTVSSWVKRIDEDGPDALVQIRQPVNRFPDLVRYLVQRLKALCPTMGKRKMADTLCRAGLHLGTTTVGRILKEPPQSKPAQETGPEPASESVADPAKRVVTAKRINHVWHVDLTVVPTSAGLWASWLPFALPQCWPFCWWVGVVIDHFSRRAMGFAIFAKGPTSVAVRSFLGRAVARAGGGPKYIISDQGKQFDCGGFEDWCDRKGIQPRFGAVGQHGSIAVVERFIQTVKNEATRRILVPLRPTDFRLELSLFFAWYNEHRPHMTLVGWTPDEVYHRRRPANRSPRFEPRGRWPRPARCALPQTLVRGQPGVELELLVTYHGGRKHLPVVTLRRAA